MKLGGWLVAALLFPTLAQADGIDWKLDKNHSNIGFVVRHLGFAKVSGKFTRFEVTKLKAAPKTGRITELEAEADTRSVDTGVAKRDDHLRSDDFFNAEKFPKATLKLKSIKWNGDKFDAVIALTLRGHTRDVNFTGKKLGFQTVNFGNGPQLRSAYESHATINRKEFGLNFSGLAEGVSVVSDDVELVLEVSIWAPAVTTTSGRK